MPLKSVLMSKVFFKNMTSENKITVIKADRSHKYITIKLNK